MRRNTGSAGSDRVKSAPSTAAKKLPRPQKSASSSSVTTKSLKHALPSDKLNPKTVDPFTNSQKHQSAFAAVYANGGVPCRLIHGSVKHKLAWDIAPDQVPFDPVFVTLAEGLRETVHPYTFVSRVGFKELLETNGAANKVIPLVPKIALSVRAALGHSEASVFEAGLDALLQLSETVGPALNPHLKTVLVPISKRMMDKRYKEKVTEALHSLEQNGGKAERNYACIEREFLAIVFGVQRYHTYLYGRQLHYFTDHKPLVMIIDKGLTNAPPRLQRMLLKLRGYSIQIEYKPVKEMPLPDTLSRLPSTKRSETIDLDVRVDFIRFTPEKTSSSEMNRGRTQFSTA
ncbi:hypothetical protein ScPMuIL_000878 [Solemya velum]